MTVSETISQPGDSATHSTDQSSNEPENKIGSSGSSHSGSQTNSQSPKALASAVAGHAVELAHLELQLAKAEVSERLASGLVGVAWIVIGAALLSAAIITLVRAAVDGLAPTLPAWAASALVGAVCLVVAATSFWIGVGCFKKTTSVTAAAQREMENDKRLVEESLK